MRGKDLLWVVPLGVGIGVTTQYDQGMMSDLGVNASREKTSRRVSDFGATYANVGYGFGLYALGAMTHSEHMKETGSIAVESLADTLIVTSAFKLAANRARPQDPNAGDFWPSGNKYPSSSFPSAHAATSFALATVLASQYRRTPIVGIGAYTFATAISASRVTAREHFPSDVITGAAAGTLIGYYVAHRRGSDFNSNLLTSVEPYSDRAHGSIGLTLRFDADRAMDLTSAHAESWLEKSGLDHWKIPLLDRFVGHSRL
jgi:hypothetical protein